MKKILMALLAIGECSCVSKMATEYPTAEKIPHRLEKQGDVRIDNYFWMKERENPKLLQHLTDENNFTESKLAPVKALEEQLFQEMKKRTKEDESTYPIQKGAYRYWAKFIPGGQYPVYLRQKGPKAPPETLIDGNAMAKGHEYFQSTAPIMSPNQELMAVGIDTQGRRFFNFEFTNLTSRKKLPVKVEKVSSNLVWAADNKTVFYTAQNPDTLRAENIYRLNIENGEKTLVYHEKDETFNAYLYQSISKKHTFISASSTLTSEILYIESLHPEKPFDIFLQREREHEYDVIDGGDRFYIVSNWQAKNFRVFETPYNQTNKSNWKEIIPHRDDTLITGLIAFKKNLVLSEKSKGLDQIRIYDRSSLASSLIPFLDQSYTASVHSNVNFDSHLVRYDYESMRLPQSTFDFDMNTKTSKLLKTREVPNYNPELYRTERLWVTARDGTKVPVSLLMKKDFVPSAQNPLLVYGYGSYGASSDPYFSQTIMSLIDRGFVYAIAHIRGGSELGRTWYDDGRVLNKKNTFFDFIDVTDSLIKQKYADPKRVYAYGGSAGGLLMGVIINERPELYHGVVAAVPFVDIITTMLDESIPLTTGEYDEWGNPNEKKYYDYIKSYSPYDNVKKHDYPNLLVTTGLHDSQVQYWEPAKWVAKIREMKTNPSLVLLKTNMSAGHGGASGRYDSLKERATDFAFMLMLDKNRVGTQ